MNVTLGSISVFWNGKTYDQKKYFVVKSLNMPYDKGTTHIWHNERGWIGANAQMPYLSSVVAYFQLEVQ